MTDLSNDPFVQRLLTERGAKVLLAAAPPELREAYEGDLSERLQDLIAEHGVDGARRWLRRELLRSTPRMLAQRARGGAHPVRRAQLAGCMLTLAVSETWLLDRPTTGPVSSIFAWAVVILFACAVVVRAATFIQGSWMSASFLEYVLVHVEGVQSPFLVTSSLIAAIGIALTLHMPWNVATWRFLTTWGGGAEDEPRRPRAS